MTLCWLDLVAQLCRLQQVRRCTIFVNGPHFVFASAPMLLGFSEEARRCVARSYKRAIVVQRFCFNALHPMTLDTRSSLTIGWMLLAKRPNGGTCGVFRSSLWRYCIFRPFQREKNIIQSKHYMQWSTFISNSQHPIMGLRIKATGFIIMKDLINKLNYRRTKINI